MMSFKDSFLLWILSFFFVNDKGGDDSHNDEVTMIDDDGD